VARTFRLRFGTRVAGRPVRPAAWASRRFRAHADSSHGYSGVTTCAAVRAFQRAVPPGGVPDGLETMHACCYVACLLLGRSARAGARAHNDDDDDDGVSGSHAVRAMPPCRSLSPSTSSRRAVRHRPFTANARDAAGGILSVYSGGSHYFPFGLVVV
jgi:hypothetical protein